jgi:hypothetical protein
VKKTLITRGSCGVEHCPQQKRGEARRSERGSLALEGETRLDKATKKAQTFKYWIDEGEYNEKNFVAPAHVREDDGLNDDIKGVKIQY